MRRRRGERGKKGRGEWVQDGYSAYLKGPVTDPQGPRRVKRGGGFTNVPRNCRPATRNSAEPGSRRFDVGFRVLRELDAGQAELPSSAVPLLAPEANLSR